MQSVEGDYDDGNNEQNAWYDDDHVGEEGVDRWQLSLV